MEIKPTTLAERTAERQAKAKAAAEGLPSVPSARTLEHAGRIHAQLDRIAAKRRDDDDNSGGAAPGLALDPGQPRQLTREEREERERKERRSRGLGL